MATFTLDTSGHVPQPVKGQPDLVYIAWHHLTPFAQGYVEAMFAGMGDVWTDGPFVPLSGPGARSEIVRPGFRHLAPETVQRIIGDCERLVAYSRDVCKVDGYERSLSDGRWFWDARQRGEWAAKGFSPLTVSLDDDGLVYLRESA